MPAARTRPATSSFECSTAPTDIELEIPSTNSITRLLHRVHDGDAAATEELFRRVYSELRRLADNCMVHERPDHSLQPSALVHEAYLRLFAGDRPDFVDRNHFFRLACRVMRCILVDHSRHRSRKKRTPPGQPSSLDDLCDAYEDRARDLLCLNDALERLGQVDPTLLQLVELKFFGGQSMEEASKNLAISLRTAERSWHLARAWLRKELR